MLDRYIRFSLPGSSLWTNGRFGLGILTAAGENTKQYHNLNKHVLSGNGNNRIDSKIDSNDTVNNIPVYCPGLTDGSLGDMLYFHSVRNDPGLIVDIVQDIRAMNGEAVKATPRKTGMIILGGGIPKHHICNANMMRNGADYAVFINTAQEFDGSDSGARPDEAVSWGKIRSSAKTVKVHCDATIAFPLLVAKTFASRMKPLH
ncbi:deoxyhypusine synthase-like protein [Trifolium pratense]|uniref:Deoxyhypusine synthase-like protein n=1 Tax=Trifolium pratense TaxID=57577 RepID=A0A2K3LXW1_TRIPR|nr:deoxyhypusine synthase-like protein [Trifolium pratense]